VCSQLNILRAQQGKYAAKYYVALLSAALVPPERLAIPKKTGYTFYARPEKGNKVCRLPRKASHRCRAGGQVVGGENDVYEASA